VASIPKALTRVCLVRGIEELTPSYFFALVFVSVYKLK
jgi:hypothetical protein